MGKRGIKKSRAKKIGRPKTTGSSQPMVVRMHEPRIAAVDVWIKLQNKAISRPEAIRRLVDQGLISFLSSADQLALVEASSHAPAPKVKRRIAKRRRATVGK